MTTVQAEKIARRKLSLLQLAQELGNVSKACRIVGYSRWSGRPLPTASQCAKMILSDSDHSGEEASNGRG